MLQVLQVERLTFATAVVREKKTFATAVVREFFFYQGSLVRFFCCPHDSAGLVGLSTVSKIPLPYLPAY